MESNVNTGLSLAEIRSGFGWTQEDTADALGVAVSTVSRWERKKTREPVLAGVSRKTNRRLAYLTAMLDSELASSVTESDGFEGLFHGDDLFLIHASNGSIAMSFLIKTAVGFPVVGLLRGETKRVFLDNSAMFSAALAAGDCSCEWWAPIPPDSPKVGLIDFGMQLHMNFLGCGIMHLKGRALSDIESVERPVGKMIFEGCA